MKRLLFVYNADSGLFNTVTDIAHKIFSPSTYACHLCQLAYGHFQVRGPWKAFIESALFESEFLHRDEFMKQYPGVNVPLPAVFEIHQQKPVLCLDSDSINACDNLAELQSLILQRCSACSDQTGETPPS